MVRLRPALWERRAGATCLKNCPAPFLQEHLWILGRYHEVARKNLYGILRLERHGLRVSLAGPLHCLLLKGEAQQVDRVLEAFASRWCECNEQHCFRNAGMSVFCLRNNIACVLLASDGHADVAYIICFPTIMLKTDLHSPRIKEKMKKRRFVPNSMGAVRAMAGDNVPKNLEAQVKTLLKKMFKSIRRNELPIT